MKLNLNTSRGNFKYLILTVMGVCISISGLLIYTLSPLELIVDKLLSFEPGSLLFKLWSSPPYVVLAKIYIFNVTNSEQFLAGKEKLNVTEVGPYVYQEFLTNNEGHFNENKTITFKPKREFVLRKDLSANDPENTWVVTPNIPLLGMSSFIRDKYGYFTNSGFASIVNMVDSPALKNLTPSAYLFGYDDPLVTLASTFIPSWIDFTRFGIIDRILAVDNANNTVTMHLVNNLSNKSDTNVSSPHPYSIDRFNGVPGLKEWGFSETHPEKNSKCNSLEGAFDAGLFPRHLKKNVTLKLYRRAFCRTVNINYEYTNYSSGGLKYYHYRIDKHFLSTAKENPENNCYCKENEECLPKGFGSMAPCYYGIPIVMSQPHYFNADPNILNQLNGLYPDKEKHDTVVKIIPNFGIPLSADIRIQINLKVSRRQLVAKARPFEGMILPLFWLELGIEQMRFDVKVLVYFANTIPTIQIVLAWVLGLLGVSLMATGVLFSCFISPRRHLSEGRENHIAYSPVLVLPLRTDMRRIS